MSLIQAYALQVNIFYRFYLTSAIVFHMMHISRTDVDPIEGEYGVNCVATAKPYAPGEQLSDKALCGFIIARAKFLHVVADLEYPVETIL